MSRTSCDTWIAMVLHLDDGLRLTEQRLRNKLPERKFSMTIVNPIRYGSQPMIPQHYIIESGTLFAGEYPGAREPDVALARLSSLVEFGVRTFIDLTTSADPLVRYEGLLPEVEQETGISLSRISIPIPDMDVPESEETMSAAMDAIRSSITANPAVYIHCWGGIGRTGTVAGCWLRECGHDAESALERVQHLYSSQMAKAKAGRHPKAPQTEAQRNYIRSWHTRRKSA